MTAALHPGTSVGRKLLTLWLAFTCLLFGLPAHAHELEMDSLSIRLNSQSHEVDGQFMLNPKLTRPDEGPKTFEEKKTQALGFATKHITLAVGAKKISLALRLRELHEIGGAVPGDSIMFTGSLPRERGALSVSIRPPLERIAVTVSLDDKESPTVIVTSGEPVVVSMGELATKEESTSAKTQGMPAETPTIAAPPPTSFRQVLSYIWTGVIHIVPLGWDHILFVIALTLGSLGWGAEGRSRRLVFELTAFTLAHTFTLALGALEMVQIPSDVVEPIIAFSIFAVALEHLLRGKSRGARMAIIGFFGLIHGLGFAGALQELGLSGPSFLVFLASFNLGVEVGQLVVVLLTLSLIWLLGRTVRKPERFLRGTTLAIALTGFTVGVARLL